jgi:mannitol-1-phosphate/altronate dehydrogenase
MRIVIFGAGAVGLGLLGKIFAGAGHYVCFIEKQFEIVRRLSMNPYYLVYLGGHSESVGPVTAVVPNERVCEEINSADAIFTSVRVENIGEVVGLLAEALPQYPRGELDIIAVENMPCADVMIHKAINAVSKKAQSKNINCWQGIAECVIPEMRQDPQFLASALTNGDRSGYLVLPKDLEGKFGHMRCLNYSEDFAFDWALKWHCHCALHAVIAFVGLHRGFKFIDQTVRDAAFLAELRTLVSSATSALGVKHGRASQISKRFDAEILSLINPHIPDTCQRVARAPGRKVQVGERLRDLEILIGRHPLVSEAINQATQMARMKRQ